MNWKLVPYIFILIFSSMVAAIRSLMIPQWNFKIHVLVFIAQTVFWVVTWLFIKKLSQFLDKSFPFEKNVLKRICIQIFAALVFITPFYLAIVYNFDKVNLPFVNKQFVAISSILFVVIVLFLNIGYNAFYFFKQWQKSVEEKAELQVKTADMEKEKSVMQYHHLKNQVNPHFLFNTLTSLDGLIQSDPALASEFVRHLSKVYRYVLEHKENEVVNLQTEVDFIQHYISLLEIRYKDALEIQLDISETAREKGIVMVTMQMLIDNAIKHNSMQSIQPLSICISDKGENLHVANNKQIKKLIETSSKQGLKQLIDLYAFLTDRNIEITDEEDRFEITIPLL